MGLCSLYGEYRTSLGEDIEAYWHMHIAPGGFMGIRLAVFTFDNSEVPHFHFYRGADRPDSIERMGKGGGCLCFREPKYLVHNDHDDTLTDEEIKALRAYLNLDIGGKTVWKQLIGWWNRGEVLCVCLDDSEVDEDYAPVEQISYETMIPDYQSDMPVLFAQKTERKLQLQVGHPVVSQG